MTPVTDLDGHPGRRRLIRRLGFILWPSFLMAGVATVVFFASIDPVTLQTQTLPGVEISRETGYALGFFMFWAVCAASSALTFLLSRWRDARRRPRD